MALKKWHQKIQTNNREILGTWKRDFRSQITLTSNSKSLHSNTFARTRLGRDFRVSILPLSQHFQAGILAVKNECFLLSEFPCVKRRTSHASTRQISQCQSVRLVDFIPWDFHSLHSLSSMSNLTSSDRRAPRRIVLSSRPTALRLASRNLFQNVTGWPT